MKKCREKLARLPIVAAIVLPLSARPAPGMSLILAASKNTWLSGLITGVIILAIMTGTVGIGTALAVLLNRTSGRKAVAIGVLVVMIACAAVIAFTITSTVYITVHAWLSRE